MEYIDINLLFSLENNPRTITKEQFTKLVTSIKDNPNYFEARPLILSDRTGKLVVIAGNQRFQAALKLKLKKVPCYIMKGLTEEKEKEIIIRDNITNGEWDYDVLANEYDINSIKEWGFETINYGYEPTTSPQQTMTNITEEQIKEEAKKLLNEMIANKTLKECVCPECGAEFMIE